MTLGRALFSEFSERRQETEIEVWGSRSKRVFSDRQKGTVSDRHRDTINEGTVNDNG